MVHNRHAVTKTLRFQQVMRGQDDRLSIGTSQVSDQVIDLLRGLGSRPDVGSSRNNSGGW